MLSQGFSEITIKISFGGKSNKSEENDVQAKVIPSSEQATTDSDSDTESDTESYDFSGIREIDKQ